MKHFSEGEIRAYQDQALSVEKSNQIKNHLESCTRCQERATTLQIQSRRVHAHLANLEPDSQIQPSMTRSRAKLTTRLTELEKENDNMWNKFSTRIPRAAWVALGIIAILAISLAFAPVRAVANSFLGLFRVQQIKVVQIDPANMPEQLGSSSQLEQIFTEKVSVEDGGEPQEVASAAEASQLAGIPVRLPTEIEGEPKFMVQPGGSLAFEIDLDMVQTVLNDIGRSDIKLPKDLDGATVELDMQSGVTALYGECELDEESLEGFDPDHPPASEELNCTTLMQIPSPTISAPPGLDMTRIGEAYLQILGMDSQEAERFARNVDWTTTFVIPIPRYGMDYEDVLVDGVTGTLIHHKYREMYVLMWVNDGVVYALSGPGDKATALELADSLK